MFRFCVVVWQSDLRDAIPDSGPIQGTQSVFMNLGDLGNGLGATGGLG